MPDRTELPITAKGNPMDESTRIEQAIEAAMLMKGWLLPTTEEAITRLEAEIAANPIELPDSLKSPDAVFTRMQKPQVHRQSQALFEQNAASKSLRALAAKDGGEIADEVRIQMQRDGEEAQRELEQRLRSDKIGETP